MGRKNYGKSVKTRWLNLMNETDVYKRQPWKPSPEEYRRHAEEARGAWMSGDVYKRQFLFRAFLLVIKVILILSVMGMLA